MHPIILQGVSPRQQADDLNTKQKKQPEDELSSPSSSSSSTPFASASTPSTSTTSNVLSSEESDTDDGMSILSFLSSYYDTPGGPGIRHSMQVDHASIETSAANEQDEIIRHTIPNAGQDAADDVKSPSVNSIDDPSPIFTPSFDTSSTPSTSSSSTANTPVDNSSKLNNDKPGAGTTPTARGASSTPTRPNPSPGATSPTPGSGSTANTHDGDGPSKLNIDKPGAGTIPTARSASSSPTPPSPSSGANSPTSGSSSTANTSSGDSASKLNNDKPGASTMPDPATTSSSSTPPAPSPGANPPSPSNPDRSHPSPSHDNGHRYGGSRNPPSTPGSHSSQDNGGWDSDGDRSGSRDNSPKAVPGPKLALKVGEVGQPPFLSGSGNSMMWPAEDGSIIFRTTSEAPANFFTGSAGKREVTTTEIVAPDSSRQKRVYKARAALMKELQEGGVSESKEGTWGAWGWVPFGRQHRRDVEAARSHLGEVTMTLDDKACVVSRELKHTFLCQLLAWYVGYTGKTNVHVRLVVRIGLSDESSGNAYWYTVHRLGTTCYIHGFPADIFFCMFFSNRNVEPTERRGHITEHGGYDMYYHSFPASTFVLGPSTDTRHGIYLSTTEVGFLLYGLHQKLK